jgi:uncharacterized protein
MHTVVLVTALAVVVHNGLVAIGPGEVASLAASLGLTGAVLGAAHRAGLTARSVGLTADRRSLTRAAVAAAVTVAAVLIVSPFLPPAAAPVDAGWFRLLVVIPVGTALCEEVIFRGVLLAACDRLTGPRASTMAVSVLFGLWHVAGEVARLGQAGPGMLAGVVATTAASALVLVPLRRRSGDLAAPVAVHAATNMTVLALLAVG